jgi:lysophospholipase L1-like esterase
MFLTNQLIFAAVILLSNLFVASSMPSPPQAPIGTTTLSSEGTSGDPQDPLIPDVPLRILPLGNSITWGYGSTTGNGYRQPLLSLLPNPVKYIGSEHSGNMANNENEGHPGAIIFQIALYADPSLALRPNVILLMAGTNDMIGNFGVDEAPDRLGVLIDRCVAACPDAVVLVAQLTPSLNEDAQARIEVFNAAIPGLVSQRVREGKKVLTVDMTKYVKMNGLMDGLHPNDEGYDGMARAWYDSLGIAAGKGWIGKPVDVEEVEEVEEL